MKRYAWPTSSDRTGLGGGPRRPRVRASMRANTLPGNRPLSGSGAPKAVFPISREGGIGGKGGKVFQIQRLGRSHLGGVCRDRWERPGRASVGHARLFPLIPPVRTPLGKPSPLISHAFPSVPAFPGLPNIHGVGSAGRARPNKRGGAASAVPPWPTPFAALLS